jgi:phage N-6-adenine-methyltransferase
LMSNFCTIDREIEAKLKAEVADLMAKAEAADAADPRKSAAALESPRRRRERAMSERHSFTCDAILCAVCREPFEPSRSDAKTCSYACRQVAYRRRLGVTPRKGRVTDKVYHRSACERWGTPPEIFGPLDLEFGFTLDVCALPENAKCAAFLSPLEDGLSQPWTGVCWMNPPYGQGIVPWVKKAYETAQLGKATIVALVPSRTGTRWWHDYIQDKPGVEIRFLPGRIKYVGASNPAPFDNAVIVFRSLPVARVEDTRRAGR